MTNSIKDGYIGIKGNDWINIYSDLVKKGKEEAEKIMSEVTATTNSLTGKAFDYTALESIDGEYNDPWFGDVVIKRENDKTYLISKRSPRLTGELLYYKGNTFIVKWKDRSFDADAFVHFAFDNDGKIAGMKMKAISPLTDFSFDFQDLEFTKKDTSQ